MEYNKAAALKKMQLKKAGNTTATYVGASKTSTTTSTQQYSHRTTNPIRRHEDGHPAGNAGGSRPGQPSHSQQQQHQQHQPQSHRDFYTQSKDNSTNVVAKNQNPSKPDFFSTKIKGVLQESAEPPEAPTAMDYSKTGFDSNKRVKKEPRNDPNSDSDSEQALGERALLR